MITVQEICSTAMRHPVMNGFCQEQDLPRKRRGLNLLAVFLYEKNPLCTTTRASVQTVKNGIKNGFIL